MGLELRLGELPDRLLEELLLLVQAEVQRKVLLRRAPAAARKTSIIEDAGAPGNPSVQPQELEASPRSGALEAELEPVHTPAYAPGRSLEGKPLDGAVHGHAPGRTVVECGGQHRALGAAHGGHEGPAPQLVVPEPTDELRARPAPDEPIDAIPRRARVDELEAPRRRVQVAAVLL